MSSLARESWSINGGDKMGLRVAYGMLTVTVETDCGKQSLAEVRLEVLAQLFAWKKGGVEDTD